jgi:hypothetical protein
MADYQLASVIINGSGQYSGEIDWIYDIDYIGGLDKRGKLSTKDLLKVKQRLAELTEKVEEQLQLRILRGDDGSRWHD